MPQPSHWTFWIGTALLFKFLYFIFFIKFFSNVTLDVHLFTNFWGTLAPDTYTYFEPIEHLILQQDFSFLFKFRMYGYGLPYLFLRYFFEPSTALNVLITIQTILSAISVYYLSLMASNWLKNSAVFYFVFMVYFLLISISFYDIVALTESFSTSCLIISIYFLAHSNSNVKILLSGGFLAWGIFMRPVFFPLVLFFIIYHIYQNYSLQTKKLLIHIFIFLIPIIIFESIWLVGMKKYNGKFYLTTPSLFHPSYLDSNHHSMEKINFLKTIGEDWEKTNWFTSNDPELASPYVTQTSIFNMDSLRQLKLELIQFDTISNTASKLKLNLDLKRKLNSYAQAIKIDYPLVYYIVNPIKNLIRISVKSSTHRMFGEYSIMNSSLKFFRFFLDLIFWLIEIVCILTPFFYVRVKYCRSFFVLLLSIIAYFYIIHSLVFKSSDNRYLLPVMPLMAMIFSYSISLFTSYLNSFKRN